MPYAKSKRAWCPTGSSSYVMPELSFELEEETEKGDILKRVLSEVVPRHSHTLEVLGLSSSWGSHWVIGHFPGYVAGVSQRSKLRVLGIVVDRNKDFMVCVILAYVTICNSHLVNRNRSRIR